MNRPALRDVNAPAEQRADIYAAWRKEIEARDWAATHISGDRNPALTFVRRVGRGWRG